MVRIYYQEKAAQMGESFWNRPPCKDGRIRYADEVKPGKHAIWVLEPISAVEYRECTAFFAGEQYVELMLQKCWGDGDGLAAAGGG
jgi:hypothetical protein